MIKTEFYFGNEEEVIKSAYGKVEKENIVERIWKKDYTVWSSSPVEISNRLGWLDSPYQIKDALKEIENFVNEIKKAGFENVLLLGMGGSSLAPEVFSNIFGTEKGFLKLYVLDSTHPDNIAYYADKLDPRKTLYLVSTKSGGTIETISFMKFFYTFAAKIIGVEYVGKHFTAITDPGSGLEEYAKKYKFRKIFLNNPDIGGRFSAISMFGMVPAALIGVKIEKILEETYKVMEESKKGIKENSSLEYGSFIGALANVNKDKLTFIVSKSFNPFGVWVEQLIAESTGKINKGILPVENEKILEISKYKKDRVFIYIKLKDESQYEAEVENIIKAGFSVIKIELDSIYQLGAEFFKWEFATAVAGYLMNVQPFDQPDVESAKILAREMIKAFQKEGKLPELAPTIKDNDIEIITDINLKEINTCVKQFLDKYLDKNNGYVSIQAYVKTDEKVIEALNKLRNSILAKYSTATTIGIGPRFLHSTGQLHKGDRGTGVFIQIISTCTMDYPVPAEPLSNESSFSFCTLVNSQSLGDRQALLNNGRKVLRIVIKNNVPGNISKLASF